MSEENIAEETTVNQETTSSQEGISTVDGQSEQTEIQSQGKSNDNTVPYSRFKEVNDQLRTFKEQASNAVTSLTGGVKQQEETNAEPKREQFQNDADYYRALGMHGGRQGFQEAKTQEEQQGRADAAQQQRTNAETNFATKATEAAKKYTNFNEVLAASTVSFSDPVSMAIQASPVAGDLAYALATNPTEAARIASLPVNEAIYALGTLSAQIPGSNGQPVKMSNMPNPINPVGTAKPSGAKPYSDDMSQEDFDSSSPYSDFD